MGCMSDDIVAIVQERLDMFDANIRGHMVDDKKERRVELQRDLGAMEDRINARLDTMQESINTMQESINHLNKITA